MIHIALKPFISSSPSLHEKSTKVLQRKYMNMLRAYSSEYYNYYHYVCALQTKTR